MPILINFKICDNSKDCGGITSCPNKVFSWEPKKKTILIDNSKCISCGVCEPTCPVGAIRVAHDAKEVLKITKEIASDKRKVSDLFVDRFGAQPLHPAFLIPQEKFGEQILESSKPVVAELFNNSSINCLYCSIPVKELFLKSDIKYRKVSLSDDSLLKRFSVEKLPALLFFKNGKLVGKIEGHYPPEQIEELKSKLKPFLKK